VVVGKWFEKGGTFPQREKEVSREQMRGNAELQKIINTKR